MRSSPKARRVTSTRHARGSTRPERKSSPNVAVAGERLRRRRHLAGLTVAGLAERVGVSAPHVSMLELGHRRCSPPLFVALCDALGVPERERHLFIRADGVAA